MATMMAGTKGDSTLYAIGDYLYIGSGSRERPREAIQEIIFWLCCKTGMADGVIFLLFLVVHWKLL